MPTFGLTFAQSVLPVLLTSRLPSPPSKVLPASGGEHDGVVPFGAKSHPVELSAKLAAGIARLTAHAAAAISTLHLRRDRRNRREPRPAGRRPEPRTSNSLIHPP